LAQQHNSQKTPQIGFSAASRKLAMVLKPRESARPAQKALIEGQVALPVAQTETGNLA